MENIRFIDSSSRRRRWATVILICLIFCPLHGMEKVIRTRTFKGIVEETVKSDIDGLIIYYYTTHEARAASKALVRKTKLAGYSRAHHNNPQRIGRDKAAKDFETYLYKRFFGHPDVRHSLQGMSMTIWVYSTADGKVILDKIRCRERLPDLLGIESTKRLMETIKSYRFEPFRLSGNYRMEWFACISVPKENAKEKPITPPFLPPTDASKTSIQPKSHGVAGR